MGLSVRQVQNNLKRLQESGKLSVLEDVKWKIIDEEYEDIISRFDMLISDL